MDSISNHRDVFRHPYLHRFVELGSRLALDPEHMVIFGSAPLLLYGLRGSIRDLDVVARGVTWERAAQYGEPAVGTISGAPVVHFWGGRIQFFRQWISPAWDTDRLIDNAELVGGLRFARLTDVLYYKRELGRPKDMADIHALTGWMPDRSVVCG